MGFDWLLRLRLGRDLKIRLFGPPGFLDQVGHRLAAYTWNLVENYDTDFSLEVMEVNPSGEARSAVFRCQAAFRRQDERTFMLPDGVLLDEESFLVRCAILDHKIPCLAFALEEKEHINVWKNRLDEMDLPTGPWLQDVKRAVRAGLPDGATIRVWWREGAATRERFLPLGELKERILDIVPGQKIAYVTDVVYHENNARRIEVLAKNADVLFIETPFLDQDVERATSRYHLTARQAGMLARRAGVKTVVPFHFSPRYDDHGEQLRREMAQVFGFTET